MATIFDTPATDEAADDALQVVDLGDIVIDDQVPSPAPAGRRRRVTLGNVVRLALVFALGMALSVPIVAGIRHIQGEDEAPQVDIQDRHLELPSDLPPPVQDAAAPPPESDDPQDPDPPGMPDTPDTATDAAAKLAMKDAATGTPPPTGATTPAGPPTEAAATAPATTGSSAPSTTAATSTTTPSATLPDGSPDPHGPGPDGHPPGSLPDPWGSDEIDP
jgi:hypothetical protein